MTGQLLWTLVTWVCLTRTTCFGCTPEEVIACKGQLKHYDFTAKSSVLFPDYPDNSLAVICGFYMEMEVCLRPVRVGCDIAQRSQFAGFEAAARYLCEDGRDEYMRQRKCFNKAETLQVAQECNHTYAEGLRAVTADREAPMEERKDRLCGYMMDQIRCLQKGVSVTCGPAAGDWIYDMQRHLLKPTMDEFTCFQGKKTQLGIPAVFGIMLAVFTFVMSIILGIVLCQRHKQRPSPLRPAKPRSGQHSKHMSTMTSYSDRQHAQQPLVASKRNGRNSPARGGRTTETQLLSTGGTSLTPSPGPSPSPSTLATLVPVASGDNGGS